MNFFHEIITSNFVILVSLFSFLIIFIGNRFSDKYTNILFFVFIGALAILDASSILDYYFRTLDTLNNWRYVTSILDYLLRTLCIVILVLILFRREKIAKFIWLLLIPLAIEAIFVITSPFTKIVFSFDALFNFASSYILNDYKSLILRAKSYIEMISIFFSVINFRKKDLNKYIEAYSGLIFCSLEKKSVDEYVKEIYNETYKDLLNIDFYSFKSFVRNPLYLLFLKSVNFIVVAKERIKDNKEIKNIYNFSCELVHSSLQLIKYKENMQQMSKALFLFLTKETMDLVNKIKTRIKRVVKSDDVNLNFAKSLDGLNYLYELIETTDVDINQNFETIS